jgi:hypothetical protein
MEMETRMESLNGIQRLVPDVVDLMEDMLHNPKVSPIVKTRIMEMVLERTFGRPEAAVKLTTAQQSVEAAQARISAIVSEILIKEE